MYQEREKSKWITRQIHGVFVPLAVPACTVTFLWEDIKIQRWSLYLLQVTCLMFLELFGRMILIRHSSNHSRSAFFQSHKENSVHSRDVRPPRIFGFPVQYALESNRNLASGRREVSISMSGIWQCCLVLKEVCWTPRSELTFYT